jgi:hypothetical protein
MPTFTRRPGVRVTAPTELLLRAPLTCACLRPPHPGPCGSSPGRGPCRDRRGHRPRGARTVRVRKGVGRMILDEGCQLYGLSVLESDLPALRAAE